MEPSDELLIALVKHLGVMPGVNLAAGDGAAQEALGVDEQELATLIREASDRRLIWGEEGPAAMWFRVVATPAGLRFAGEWPPRGHEASPGPWRDGHWGRHALPTLTYIRDDAPPSIGGLHGSNPDDERARLATLDLLIDEGYIAAERQPHLALSEPRLTETGREILAPTIRTPVDEAIRRLNQGDRVDAVIHAVEVGLGDRLKALAAARGIIEPPDGDTFHKLSTLNDQLGSKTNHIYAQRWKMTIDSALKLRNEFGHGRGDAMSFDDARCLIDMVAMILRHLPGPA